jgi:hypothetical protein
MGKIGAFGCTAAVVAVATLIDSIPRSAQARDLLDAILGVFGGPPPAAGPILQVPPDVVSAPPLRIVITPRWSSAFSGVSGYCVRLCDGRYFPLPRFASSATPATLCNVLYPGSRTMVYWSAPIDQAKTSNGSRYSDLTMAFDYRKNISQNCTCNGNDIFGTAAISIRADITLRPGDVVVTENGVRVFVGSAEAQHKASDFTSVQNYSGHSADQRRKLLEIKITHKNPLESNAMDFNTRVILGAAPVLSR